MELETKVLKQLHELNKNGLHEEALFKATEVLSDFPNSFAIHNFIGGMNFRIGKLDEALDAFKKCYLMNPNSVEAINNIGSVLKNQGKIKNAMVIYQKALELDPKNAELYYNLGQCFDSLRQPSEALGAYRTALILDPMHIQAKIASNNLKRRAVPEWHVPMMNDASRNEAYRAAIQLATKDTELVFEIGTGSGLLAMMAADSGSNEVITCEASKTIASVAKKIIAKNGFEQKITVLDKPSTEVVVGVDIPHKADLIISEILSAGFVGEGVQNTIADANQRLLKKGGKMIPESGNIKIALIGESDDIKSAIYINKINGYDLSDFNDITPNFHPIHLDCEPVFVSAEYDAFHINLLEMQSVKTKQEIILKMPVTRDGLCYGLIQWMHVNVYQGIDYENKPGSGVSHWPTPLYSFDEPIYFNKGDLVQIKGTLLKDSVWFELHE